MNEYMLIAILGLSMSWMSYLNNIQDDKIEALQIQVEILQQQTKVNQ